MEDNANGGLQLAGGPLEGTAAQIVSPQALGFVAELEKKFGPRRRELLGLRAERQERYDAGNPPDFDPATAEIRESDWQVSPPPPVLEDRRVEITGPCDRKMIINALNSGARVFMADIEDSHSPVWSKTVEAHVNLYDAARGSIEHRDESSGKHYVLQDNPAQLIVRPRGWHLDELNVRCDGAPVSATLFDLGVHLHNNALQMAAAGKGPFLYLPKTEHHLEAQLWADVIAHAERSLGLERGAVKVTLLIETLPAAFCMEEILHALRDNIIGLNCGRWDYIFSYIKVFRKDSARMLPDRNQVHMGVPFLDAYSKLLVQTCHRRNAHAMGGMSAFIPIRNDDEANKQAFAKVREDKLREANNGHDGTWVAHPGLVATATEVFESAFAGSDHKSFSPPGKFGQAELTACPAGTITGAGFDNNIQVALLYTSAWLAGRGAVPIFNLMEDAATAEISRSQLWQWIHAPAAKLDSGEAITEQLFTERLEAALTAIRGMEAKPSEDSLGTARDLLADLVCAPTLEPFLTTCALPKLG